MGMQPSLSILNQKYLCKYKDTYFILQNKYLRINKDIVLEQRYFEVIAPLLSSQMKSTAIPIQISEYFFCFFF